MTKPTPFTDLARDWLRDANLQTATRLAFLQSAGLSDSTLARNFTDEGASWMRLLNEERARRCQLALAANPKITRRSLALIAGYRNGRNLCRNAALIDRLRPHKLTRG